MKHMFVVLALSFLVGCAGVKHTSVAMELEFSEALLRTRISEAEQEVVDLTAELKKLDAIDQSAMDEAQKAELRLSRDRLREEKRHHEAVLSPALEQLTKIQQDNKSIREANRKSDCNASGIRYYRTSPYLLVYSNGKGGIVWELHHLPDSSKLMSAKPYSWFASLESSFVFDERGRMTKAVAKPDASAVPKAIFDAIESFASELSGSLVGASLDGGTDAEDGHPLPVPHLYKVVVGPAGVEFRGGPANMGPIRSTLVKQPTAAKKEEKKK
jgi:hypothetical protein